MILLVTGGRDYIDKVAVDNVLNTIHAKHRIRYIINGGAPGADALASLWAIDHGVELLEYPANWEAYGRAAGPIRNQTMLDRGRPDAYHAFPGGRGTADMVQRCKRAGVPEV